MRTTVVIIAVISALLSASSCKQCTECTKYPGDAQKLCKKDFATDDSYTQAYHHLIADGYKCD